MLTCAQFVDRLYDEDCRGALKAEVPLPDELQEHHDSCAACAQEWALAAQDLSTFPALLLESAPLTLEHRIRARVRGGVRPPPVLDWTQGMTWAAVGAAVAFSVLPRLFPVLSSLGPLSLSLIGASLAFAASAAQETLRDVLA